LSFRKWESAARSCLPITKCTSLSMPKSCIALSLGHTGQSMYSRSEETFVLPVYRYASLVSPSSYSYCFWDTISSVTSHVSPSSCPGDDNPDLQTYGGSAGKCSRQNIPRDVWSNCIYVTNTPIARDTPLGGNVGRSLPCFCRHRVALCRRKWK
jgi:hypothetical protein